MFASNVIRETPYSTSQNTTVLAAIPTVTTRARHSRLQHSTSMMTCTNIFAWPILLRVNQRVHVRCSYSSENRRHMHVHMLIQLLSVAAKRDTY